MNLAQDLARKLLQIKAIKLRPQNPFTWASGWRSPIYCDNRTVLSYPEVRSFVIDQFVAESQKYQPFDVVAGVATAGIPHGALLADRLSLPFIYVRSKAKGHGRQNLIEGKAEPGDKVLLVEDLISTGGSSLQAVEALREAGCEVRGVMAIFSYGFQEASDRFEKAGCTFSTLSHYQALLEEARDQGYIKPEELNVLQQWRTDPSNWGK